MRIVDDRDRFREYPLAEPVLEETRAAGDCGSRYRPQQVGDETSRHARVEHHRTSAGRHFFGTQPLDRALTGTLADFGRIAQIGPRRNLRVVSPRALLWLRLPTRDIMVDEVVRIAMEGKRIGSRRSPTVLGTNPDGPGATA